MKKIAVVLVFLCGFALVGGPVTAGAGQTNQIPELSPELKAKLTPSELKWFRTFFTGNLLSRGWNAITEEVLAKTPPELRASQAERMRILGIKIGLEWCKDNSVRRVDNAKLREWGKRLKQVVKKNPHQLPETIALIDQEVESLLD